MKCIYRFKAMSTPCELSIYDKKIKADNIANAIFNEAKRLEKKYNYFDNHSLLFAINARKETKLDMETISLINKAKDYYLKTNKIFDITIGTIKDIYRHSDNNDTLINANKYLYQYIGCEHFAINKTKIYFDNKYTKLDLGGFVKEYAIDNAVTILKKNKIKNALINFGGDIFALGTKEDGTKFNIGIKNPHNPKKIVKTICVENQAVTTSASYERIYMINKKPFSHILAKDKVVNINKSVTVISNSCIQSGVYSTALLIDDTIKHNVQTIIL